MVEKCVSTTVAVSGETKESVRSHTESTTSTGGSETTHAEVRTEATTRTENNETQGSRATAGTTHAAISVTEASGSPSSETTASTGVSEAMVTGNNAETTTSAGGNTGSESSTSGVPTEAPGSQSTGGKTDSTSTAAVVTTSARVSQPETATKATEGQDTGKETVCPGTLPPAPVCHGPLGEEKSPGDTWISNCHQCTCTDAQAVDCKPKECPSPPTCQTGEKLMIFKSNDSCCDIGHCEPRTCLFNNTDYEIGASFDDPSNPCVSYTCNSTGLVAVVQDCPKQTWCAEVSHGRNMGEQARHSSSTQPLLIFLLLWESRPLTKR
ncbi:mucin-19 [Peromyscus leucopus]|uniref:mucin-19 n=1 Tax=Peromyscus leucopus TaxID=10041 RepID=UPI0018854424|nr:mucin-19 [Peromyscus leucopus]